MSILAPGPHVAPLVQPKATSAFYSRDLALLNDPHNAYSSPLAVIGHVDLNAFYAQCEQLRLGKSVDDPVVCCQWLSLIAVSYAARKFGIGRMDTLDLAKAKCPNLVVGHAAVFKKGDSHWSYLNGTPDQALHKVSLDPYRRELRKIFKILRRECDVVEKASVDECYLDFGRQVYEVLMECFPQLRDIDPHELLPPIPTDIPDKLGWVGLVTATAKEDEAARNTFGEVNAAGAPSVTDWDDICMMIGSELMYRCRAAVYDELKYTTSGGLASTKAVAKLAGGFKKPDAQVIVRRAAAFNFLENFGLTDFQQMGGKIGEVILLRLEIPSDVNLIAYVRDNWERDQIKKEFQTRKEFPSEDNWADKVYELVWAIHRQPLKLQTDVKLMMSRKNLTSRKPVNTLGDALDWLKVFSGDLFGRFIELDDENMNMLLLQKEHNEKGFIFRPRTVSLQTTTIAYSKHSRQTQFTVYKDLEKFRVALENTSFRLMCELLEGTKAVEWNPTVRFRDLRISDSGLDKIKIPTLVNMSLVVNNFVKTSDANLIDSYSKATAPIDAVHLKRMFDEVNKEPEPAPEPPKKVTRSNSYIRKLFSDFEAESAEMEKEKTRQLEEKRKPRLKQDKEYLLRLFSDFEKDQAISLAARNQSESPKRLPGLNLGSKDARRAGSPGASKSPEPINENDIFLRELIRKQHCLRCNVAVEDVFDHRDYHIALDLLKKLNGEPSNRSGSKNEIRKSKSRKDSSVLRANRKSRGSGQAQLPFEKKG